MDRAALRELFDFTTFSWDSYGRAVAKLPEGSLTRPVEGSAWPSLRDALFHIATSWDNWARDRLGIEDPLDDTPESITSWDQLQTLRDKMRGWLKTIIDDTPDEDLLVNTTPTWGGTVQATASEVVMHILLHERGHQGDVVTLLAANGGPDLIGEYLIWTQLRQRREAQP